MFEAVQNVVTAEQNNTLLMRPWQVKEVKVALFSMKADETPGPDEMNLGFYQHFWENIKVTYVLLFYVS